MIKRLELKNLTIFNELALDLSPKVNVIIGENGTGKTHLLKAAYGMCAGAPLFRNKPDASENDLETELTEQFLRLFLPLDDNLGNLHRLGADEQGSVTAHFSDDQRLTATFSKDSKSLSIQESTNYDKYRADAAFIPTKEVLSFMKGFNSLYERYELSFDQTYQDISLSLDLPRIRSENLPAESKWAIEEIEGICGGRFVFYGGGNVTFKKNGTEYSANVVAEGFRKAGMLARLLETGVVQPGVSGPLFWDEPESSLNPKLMRLLVEILLELSRKGQQIILATHEYVLLKWFDLLMDKGKEDHIVFHALFVDSNGVIASESADDYRALSPNPIADTFNDITRAQVQKNMIGLGK